MSFYISQVKAQAWRERQQLLLKFRRSLGCRSCGAHTAAPGFPGQLRVLKKGIRLDPASEVIGAGQTALLNGDDKGIIAAPTQACLCAASSTPFETQPPLVGGRSLELHARFYLCRILGHAGHVSGGGASEGLAGLSQHMRLGAFFGMTTLQTQNPKPYTLNPASKRPHVGLLYERGLQLQAVLTAYVVEGVEVLATDALLRRIRTWINAL